MQRQADPRRGVSGWTQFMSSAKVLASNEVSEPRREIPLELMLKMAEVVDETSFRDVNAFFFDVVMFFRR